MITTMTSPLVQPDPFTPRLPSRDSRETRQARESTQRERPWYLQKRDELRLLGRWSLIPMPSSPVPIDDPIADRWFR